VKVSKTLRFASKKVKLVAGKAAKVTLKLSKKNARAVRNALRHKKLTAKIRVKMGSSSQRLSIKLKR